MRWALGLVLLGVAWGAEADLDGQVAVRGLYSAADDDSPPITFFWLETDALARDLTGKDGLSLVLDASFALDLTEDRSSPLDGDLSAHERRFGQTESLDQVRQLYARMPKLFGQLDASAGRMYVAAAGNPWVDGVNLQWWLDQRRASAGLYGGVRPDPYDHSLAADQQATGAYGTFHRDGFDGQLAYNLVLRGSEVDRQFAFNRMHYKAAPGLYLATYLTLDLTDEVDTSVLLLTTDYTPVRPLNLTLSVSRYSLETYRNQTIYHNVVEQNQAVILGDEVLSLVYQRVRLSVNYSFLGHLVFYQAGEYKKRQQDNRDAWYYTVGFREDSLAGTGFRVDVRTSLRNNFSSDSWLVGLQAGRDLPLRLSVETWLTYFSGRTIGRARPTGRGDDQVARTFDEEQSLLWFGAEVAWRAASQHHLHLLYDGMQETDLQDAKNQDPLLIHTLMLRYAWVF